MYAQALGLITANYTEAASDMETGHRLLTESGDDWGATMSRLTAAMLAKFRGDQVAARQQFAALEPIFRDLGDRHRVNMVRSELAHIEAHEGHFRKAESMYHETIREWQQIGHRAAVAHQLESLAGIARIMEAGGRAARLYGAAEALRDKIGIPMTVREHVEYEQQVATLRAGMDEADFKANWSAGRSMSMDQAITLALETVPEPHT
jgi:hypothetical protein